MMKAANQNVASDPQHSKSGPETGHNGIFLGVIDVEVNKFAHTLYFYDDRKVVFVITLVGNLFFPLPI